MVKSFSHKILIFKTFTNCREDGRTISSISDSYNVASISIGHSLKHFYACDTRSDKLDATCRMRRRFEKVGCDME